MAIKRADLPAQPTEVAPRRWLRLAPDPEDVAGDAHERDVLRDVSWANCPAFWDDCRELALGHAEIMRATFVVLADVLQVVSTCANHPQPKEDDMGGKLGKRSRVPRTEAVQLILAALESATKPLSTNSIADQCGLNGTAPKLLNELRANGAIVRTKRGSKAGPSMWASGNGVAPIRPELVAESAGLAPPTPMFPWQQRIAMIADWEGKSPEAFVEELLGAYKARRHA